MLVHDRFGTYLEQNCQTSLHVGGSATLDMLHGSYEELDGRPAL